MKMKTRIFFSPQKIQLIALLILIVIASIGYATYSYVHDQQAARAHDTRQQAENTRIANDKAAMTAVEAKKKAPVTITLPGARPFRAIVDNYSQPSSLWTVVSKTLAIPLTYVPAQLVIPDVEERSDKSIEERSVRSDIATPLKTMFMAAATDSHALMIGSAYRSAALQKMYFDNYAAVSGAEAANQYSARPGESEHQTGLAVDISTVSRNCYLNECFTSTPDGQWLATNAYTYGFTLRYPKDKEAITGYQFEPWHYRYVGIDFATALHESGMTLDEAWPYLQAALTTLKQNGAI